ncbi:TonB-dependent receptor [Mucilaginibacter sp. SG564]|uniref:TonB-dependent receptor n=1 Tax=Mucilaginibacter sp. SG564 TaxID=2587022 RepID=UPI0015554272|nr:TonB-dependent receptor [Mucilaginibacter sp. SG564]NOW96046.1 TonB-linked SusC/RagA family outer membrane protein [Mucilaginibacter sp. SG564]
MKLIFIMVIVACLHVSAKTYGQLVSVNGTNKPLTDMFKQIQKETGYRFFWEGDDVSRIRLSVDIKNASLDDALQQIFNGLPLTYSISKKTVVVQKKEISFLDRIKAVLLSVDFHITVKDDKGQPLPGATISIKGNNFEKGAITDQNGESKIEKVPQGDYHIVVTSIGFARYEKNITVNGDNKDLAVTLATLSASLNEVVVVGYGTQQKASLTSSVETVSSKEIVNRPVPSVLNILQGEAAGLNIQQTDGNPGYGSTSVDIRGNSTISNNPVLYIVDGMAVNGIDYLNPNDIESVSILKDASATAIYGARASGGVLLVTTKKGKLNSKPIVQYSSIFGYQRPARLPKFVDAPQFVDLYNQAQLNDNPGVQVKFTPDQVQKYKSGELPSTNWLPYILHNQALQNQQNLSVAGGSGTADYYVSGGYLNQGGLIKNVDYKRYSTRANVNVQVSKRLKLGINTVLTKEDKLQPSYGLGNALQWSYIVPVTEYPYTKDGHDRSYRGGDQPNDIMTKAGVQNETLNTINTNFLAEFKILDNLLLNATYGYNYTSSFLSGFNNKYPLYNDDEQIVVYNNDPNSAYKANYSRVHPTTLITLNYNKSFGKHNIKALAGYSQEQDRYDYNSITRYGFLNNSLDQIDAGSSDPTLTNVSGNATEYAIRSWFGRVNYNYNGKYLLEANARYDGTSVFENKKYGFFPSVSAGWVASEEDFFKPLENTVNFLKIRASLGQVGNQNASGLYPWANTIGQDKYVLNKAASTTTFYNNSPNPNLTWEVKTTINLGLDLTLLRHLDVNVDVFRDRTTGILQYLTVPTTYGISGPQQNVGILRNQGFEVNVAYKNNIGKLTYRAAINFSDARNKILSLGGAPEQLGDNPLLVGQSRWVWYGLQAEGLFQSKEDIANHATQDPRDIPGDIKIKDVNGDGKITPDDRVVLGQATPHYRYGISLGASYGGFDVSILLQGVMSNLLRVQGGAQVPFYFNGDGNILQSQLDYWSPSNPNARYPILRTDQSINNGQFNSWWLFKAAYMRFKNAQIGYTFSDRLTKHLGIGSARFFLTGDNLFLITSKNFPKSLDPEIANYGDGSNYPQVRNISLGLNVTF